MPKKLLYLKCYYTLECCDLKLCSLNGFAKNIVLFKKTWTHNTHMRSTETRNCKREQVFMEYAVA